MRKLSFLLLNCIFVLALVVTGFSSNAFTAVAQGRNVYIGGNSAGFTLSMGGVQVIALNEVQTGEGIKTPARDAGIQNGDLITKINGRKITDVSELNQCLEECKGKEISITVRRNNADKNIEVQPQKDTESGKYKIGILIRDTLSGIGTITYIDKDNGRFGALGHAVYDENNNILGVSKGKVYNCSIVSVTKGVRGKAGELKGLFIGENSIGVSDKINLCGLYGKVDENFDYTGYQKVEIAPLSQARMGEACIYSTVNGLKPEKFSISIVKVDENNKEHKNFVIKITDKSLIEETGGIVQGMSGSPIIQDGKLIGAVTHVFLNDPTRGYGIGIENMLDN